MIFTASHTHASEDDGPAPAVVVRSKVAHGALRGVDVRAARGMPGVLGIFTGADLLAAGYGPVKGRGSIRGGDGELANTPTRHSLAVDKVRFVGEPICLVVAASRAEALAAADAVMVDIGTLPASAEPRESARLDAPQISVDVPGNTCLSCYCGEYDKTVRAFEAAARIIRLRFNGLETAVSSVGSRAVTASYDLATGSYVLYPRDDGTGAGHAATRYGRQDAVHSDYASLFHAAETVRRPISWIAFHPESFLGDLSGYTYDMDGELALDAEGTFLAMRQIAFIGIGAYAMDLNPPFDSRELNRNLATAYNIPVIEVRRSVMLTNTPPVTVPANLDWPDSNYIMERLIDAAARQMKIDLLELRRRNLARHLGRSPDGARSDTSQSELIVALDQAAAMANMKGFPVRKAESAARGKRRGLGIGVYRSVSTSPNSGSLPPGGCEVYVAEVEVDPDTGGVELVECIPAGHHGARIRADNIVTLDGAIDCAAGLPAVMNAIVDALGGRHLDVPASPRRVRQALSTPCPMLGLY